MSTLDLRNVHTVFLDRDGTINVKAAAGAYVTSPTELVLLPGAAKAVAALNAVGVRTILVTNQRWLSECRAESARYVAVHNRLEQLLAAEGAWLDASYHCPHAIGACDCRKPGPGMLLRAAREHEFDLARSIMIGDSDTDVKAGRAAGTAAILIRADGGSDAGADAVVKDLAAAVTLVLRARKTRLVPEKAVRCRPSQQCERKRQIIEEIPAGKPTRLKH
jgi:D-glycero-D-manno-heptose 1,7-bisphosphate phosphatase